MMLRLRVLGRKERGQVCKTELLEEHCTLLRLFDVRLRRSLDLARGGRQSSALVIEGEMECCLEAWTGAVWEGLVDYLC